MEFEGDDRRMDRAFVLIFFIAGIILAAYLTRLVNYYTFGHKMREKERQQSSKIEGENENSKQDAG